MMQDESAQSQRNPRSRNLIPDSENIYWRLARLGKETWIRWLRTCAGTRRINLVPELQNGPPLSNAEIKSIVEELGVSELPDPQGIDFSNTEFQDGVNFSGFIFVSEWTDRGVAVVQSVRFNGALFRREANFDGATFCNGAVFEAAIFEGYASFRRTRFSNWTTFRQANICGSADFERAEFLNSLDLVDCLFATDSVPAVNVVATRRRTTSEGELSSGGGENLGPTPFANFRFCKFSREIEMTNAEFWGRAFFFGAKFEAELIARSTRFHEICDFSGPPNSVFSSEVNFVSAYFRRGVGFTNRGFQNRARFTGCKFAGLVSFHGGSLHHDTSFLKADFELLFSNGRISGDHWAEGIPSWSDIENSFRTLSLAMKQINAHREELMFFALQMRALAEYSSTGQRLAINAYKLFSNFGQSLVRPITALGALIASAFMIFGYAALISRVEVCRYALPSEAECNSMEWVIDSFTLAVSGAMPLFGFSQMPHELTDALIDKRFHNLIYIVSVIEGVVLAVCLFLFGLALRNRFKIG